MSSEYNSSKNSKPNTRSRSRKSCNDSNKNNINDNNKNESHDKKTTPTNFLSGYKLNVIDIHSLPDPPSPDSIKRKNARRRSSPVIMSTTLEEPHLKRCKNKSSPFQDSTNKTSMTRNKKKSRNSLSIIPSPSPSLDFILSSDTDDCSTPIIDNDDEEHFKKRKAFKETIHVKNKNNNKTKIVSTRTRRDRRSLPSPECLLLSDSSSSKHDVDTTTATTTTDRVTRKSKRRNSSSLSSTATRKSVKKVEDNNYDDDTEIVRNDIKDLFADDNDDNNNNGLLFATTNNDIVPIRKRQRTTTTTTTIATTSKQSISSLPPRHASKKPSINNKTSVAANTKHEETETKLTTLINKNLKHDNNENNDNNNNKDDKNMDRIKQYIRQLCSNNTNNNKSPAISSEIANTIHTLTGYKPYIEQPAANRSTNVNNNIINNNNKRQEVLRKLYKRYVPLLDLMENYRKNSELQLEKLTGCKVEKKNGKYAYRNIMNNTLIDPNMYENLYMNAINKMKINTIHDSSNLMKNDVKNTNITTKNDDNNNHIQKLSNCSTSSTTTNNIEEKKFSSSLYSTSSSSTINAASSASSSSSTSITNKKDCLHAQELNVNKKCNINTNDGESACNILSYRSLAHYNKKETTKKTTILNEKASEKNIIKVNNTKNSNNHMNENNNSTLKLLPNRYHRSSDPEIADAEKTLWSSIDKALDVYSSKVMDINERKKKNMLQK